MRHRSCNYLESGLILGNKQLQFCCVQHSDGKKGFVKICDYDGGPLPIETIREERERLIALNNTDGADSPCKGCWNLVERDWPELPRERPFDWTGIESFFACNLRCVYCDVVLHEDSKLPQVGYDLRAVFGEMLARGWLAPGAHIVWGGGEPIALKGFERIQELLLAHDVFQQIHTNAIRHSEAIAAALARGKAELVCSVDAGTRATYERIKGADHFEDVWANLARYLATGAEVSLKYIVRDGNTHPDDVLGFVRRVAALGAKRICISADKEELHQDALTEEHALAYALMAREARRLGISVAVLDEYLPVDRSRLLGFMSDPRLDWKLKRAAARRTLAKALRAARNHARSLLGTVRASSALARAESLSTAGEAEPADVLALCEHQTRYPDPRLAATLIDGARRLAAPFVQAAEHCLGLGLDHDGWHQAERPAFVAVDNRHGRAPLEQVLWVGCYAAKHELPLTVHLEHALEAVHYTYWWPERRRLVLPPVPAGECAFFRVRTDHHWTAPDGGDPRRLGVHLSPLA